MLKPTKILVPTDFSQYSDKALKQALTIAAEYNAKVYVIHVVHERIHGALSDDYTDISISEQVIRRLERGIRERARARLLKQIRSVPESGVVSVADVVTRGVPYAEILREEEREGIDLVVISSLGQSGLARFFIGSVARNVLKGSRCPVLLTKDIFLSRPTRILVPTDFSEYSDKALRQAVDIARQYDAQVCVLHVLPLVREYAYAIDFAWPEEMIGAFERQGEQDAAERIAQQLAKCPQAGDVAVKTEIVRGLPEEEILKKAEEQDIDLIVIASLGRQGLAGYLIGGVARDVLKKAACPVLVTK